MFSVIIPLYNKANYIEKAIRSVLAQGYQNFELIIIDDGSTDKGLFIVNDILNDVSLTPPLGGWDAYSQQNQGVSTARNNGVKHAKYDYIAFLDADDWWAPTYLEEMKGLIENYPDAGIYGSSYIKVKDGKSIPANIGVEKGFERGYIDYFHAYATSPWMPLWTGSVIIPKVIFEEMQGFKPNLKLGEDFDLWVRIALKYPVALVNRPLAFYNQDVELADRAVGNHKLWNEQEHFLFNIKYLEKEEASNKNLKIILDRNRALLFPYLLHKSMKNIAQMEMNKVDWKKQPKILAIQYKSPIFITKLYLFAVQCLWQLKKTLLK